MKKKWTALLLALAITIPNIAGMSSLAMETAPVQETPAAEEGALPEEAVSAEEASPTEKNAGAEAPAAEAVPAEGEASSEEAAVQAEPEGRNIRVKNFLTVVTAGGLEVKVTLPQGEFEDGTVLRVEEITDASRISDISEAIAEESGKHVSEMIPLDMAVLKDGEELSFPQDKLRVEITADKDHPLDRARGEVYHFDSDETGEVSLEESTVSGDTVSFEVEHFSVIAWTTLTDADNATYYGTWNDATKTITFTSEQPDEGTSEPIENIRDFIQKYRAEVEIIDFRTDVKLKPEANENTFLFSGCAKLENIVNLNRVDTSEVTNMAEMFSDCKALKGVDLSSFDTSKVERMTSMFRNCESLKTIDFSNFDTSNVSSMSYMFQNCKNLVSLDLSYFYTPSFSKDSWQSAESMFRYCSSLESLDISNFETDVDDNMYQTFAGCVALKKLTLGSKITHKKNTVPDTFLSGIWQKEDGTTAFADELFGDPIIMPGTWTRTDVGGEGHYYRSDGSLDKENMWEVHSPADRFTGYCINLNRSGVGGYLDRTVMTNDLDIELLLHGNPDVKISTGYQPLGNNLREAMITLAYFGFPNDAALMQERYGLSDAEFMNVTQNAIWDFVDRYDAKAGPSVFAKDPAKLQAYNELLSHRFAEIPNGDKYLLFIYKSQEDDRRSERINRGHDIKW